MYAMVIYTYILGKLASDYFIAIFTECIILQHNQTSNILFYYSNIYLYYIMNTVIIRIHGNKFNF